MNKIVKLKWKRKCSMWVLLRGEVPEQYRRGRGGTYMQ
jgi:hypothetical protein